MKHNRGFSMVSVTIVALVASIILVSIAQMMNFMFKGQEVATAQEDIRVFISRIHKLLAVNTNCSNVLGTKQFSGTASTLSTEKIPNSLSPSGIQIFKPGSSTEVLAQNGTVIGSKTSIASMSVRNFILNSPNVYLADLYFEFEVKKSHPISKHIPLTLQTSASGTNLSITSCQTIGSSPNVPVHGLQIFDADGVFVVPDDVTQISVEVWGGGGGGGTGGNLTRGAGGGGGGYGKSLLNVTPNTSFAISVGSAGSAGAGCGAGGAGGTTQFGSLVSATGGNGGAHGTPSAWNPGGSGGSSSADHSVNGGQGFEGLGSGVGMGYGGSSPNGGQGGVVASAGSVPGGGGSGGNAAAGGPPGACTPGYSGAPGKVVVSW